MLLVFLLLKNDGERDDKNDLEEREDEKEVTDDADADDEDSAMIVFLISRNDDFKDAPDRLILSSSFLRKSVACEFESRNVCARFI